MPIQSNMCGGRNNSGFDKNLFYHHLLESGVDADHIIRFAFDSADDLYLIGESLIQIEKEKRGVDPEKFMVYIHSKVVGEEMYYLLLDEIQMLDCFKLF